MEWHRVTARKPTTYSGLRPSQVNTKPQSSKTARATENFVLNWWTKYYKYLYQFQLKTDCKILTNKQTRTSEPAGLPGKSLKEGNSPGVDNVLAELLKQGGGKKLPSLQGVWECKEWSKQWMQSLVIPLAINIKIQQTVPDLQTNQPCQPPKKTHSESNRKPH